jgi:hypothetical protein
MKPELPKSRLAIDSTTRTFLVCALALAYPLGSAGFELGAYGELLYPRKLTAWATVTATFLALAVIPRRHTGIGNKELLILAIPIMWALLAQFFSSHSDGTIMRPVLFLLATGTYVFCLPYAIYVVAQILNPEVLQLSNRMAVIALLAMGALFVAMGYLSGANNDLLMTCEQFEMAGEKIPDNCRPAPAPH